MSGARSSDRSLETLCTDLNTTTGSLERTELGISSLMDTWLLLQTLETSGERNRHLYLPKSRGMAHSNQVREFILTNAGIQLRDVYLGPAGVLTGAARMAQEARDATAALERQQDLDLASARDRTQENPDCCPECPVRGGARRSGPADRPGTAARGCPGRGYGAVSQGPASRAAPTLFKELPSPLRKFIGDLSQNRQTARGVGGSAEGSSRRA
jgi:hypothetical protein